MNIYRNVKNQRRYRLYEVTSKMGCWVESEDIITNERRKLNSSSWKRKDFVLAYTI